MGDLLEVAITPPTPTPSPGSDTPPVDPTPDQSSNTITTVPAQPPTAAAPALPSTKDMQQGLEQSGKLLNEITIHQPTQVDTSPLSALQPQNMLQTAEGPQPIRLPSQHQTPLQGIQLGTSSSIKETNSSTLMISQIIKYVGCLGLFVMSLYNFFKGLRFLLVDYGPMEREVFDYILPEEELLQMSLKAIAQVLIAVVSAGLIFFMLRKMTPSKRLIFMAVWLFLLQIYYASGLSDTYSLYNLMSWL